MVKTPTCIYAATKHQKLKLWFAAIMCVICSLFTCFMVFGMTDAEIKQDYISVNTARAWQALMLVIGNLMLIGMLYLSGRYVLGIDMAEGGIVEIKTWSIWGQHKKILFPPGAWEQKEDWHQGQSSIPGTVPVHAPWIGLKVKRGKKYVIDTDGDFPEGIGYFFKIIHFIGV